MRGGGRREDSQRGKEGDTEGEGGGRMAVIVVVISGVTGEGRRGKEGEGGGRRGKEGEGGGRRGEGETKRGEGEGRERGRARGGEGRGREGGRVGGGGREGEEGEEERGMYKVQHFTLTTSL